MYTHRVLLAKHTQYVSGRGERTWPFCFVHGPQLNWNIQGLCLSTHTYICTHTHTHTHTYTEVCIRTHAQTYLVTAWHIIIQKKQLKIHNEVSSCIYVSAYMWGACVHVFQTHHNYCGTYIIYITRIWYIHMVHTYRSRRHYDEI